MSPHGRAIKPSHELVDFLCSALFAVPIQFLKFTDKPITVPIDGHAAAVKLGLA